MMTLILYVCSTVAAADCKEVHFILDGVTAPTCIMAGEEKAIEWLNMHEGWRLVGVTCQWGVGERKV